MESGQLHDLVSAWSGQAGTLGRGLCDQRRGHRWHKATGDESVLESGKTETEEQISWHIVG